LIAKGLATPDAKNELVALGPWYNGEKAKAVANPDKSKIKPAIELLSQQLAHKIGDIGNRYHLHEFVYRTFNVQVHFDKIKNTINDQLHKHLGQPGMVGDGHNNTATAAEADPNFRPKYPQLHRDKTIQSRDGLLTATEALDEVINDFGVDITHHRDYGYIAQAKSELADCNEALNNPAGYLARKGYK